MKMNLLRTMLIFTIVMAGFVMEFVDWGAHPWFMFFGGIWLWVFAGAISANWEPKP